MTATIIPFATRRSVAKHRPDVAAILAGEIMREYVTHSIDVVEKAIKASNAAIDKGGTFVDALEAAHNCVQNCGLQTREADNAFRNFERTLVFRRRRERLAAIMLRIVEIHIRIRMPNASEHQMQMAIDCARRVLAGGGSIGRTLQLVLPTDPPGAA